MPSTSSKRVQTRSSLLAQPVCVVWHSPPWSRLFLSLSLWSLSRSSALKQKLFSAEALGVDVQTVEHCVEGLAFLFTESARYFPAPVGQRRLLRCSVFMTTPRCGFCRARLTEIDFLDSLLLLSFPQELSEKIKEVSPPIVPWGQCLTRTFSSPVLLWVPSRDQEGDRRAFVLHSALPKTRVATRLSGATFQGKGKRCSPLTSHHKVASRTEHRQMKPVYTLQLETMSTGMPLLCYNSYLL